MPASEQRERHVDRAAPRACARPARCPASRGDRDRQARGVDQERHEVAGDLGERARAVELVGQVGGRVQAEERVAGDDRVDRAPDQRRDQRQRERSATAAAGARQPSQSQYAPPSSHASGRSSPARSSATRAPPAARPLGLERGGPQHEREERLVDVGARGVEQQRERRAGEQRGHHARPAVPHRRAQPVDGAGERDVAETGEEHEHAVGVLAEEAEHARRSRGRADAGSAPGRPRSVGMWPCDDLAPPDQVVVGVVVGIGRDERPDERRAAARSARRRQLDAGAALMRGRAAPRRARRRDGARRAAPQRQRQPHAEQRPRQRVLEERRVAPRVQHERRERRGDGRAHRIAARRRGTAAGTPATSSARYTSKPGHALLGGDGDRDRVRRRHRLLGRAVLRAPVGPRERAASRGPAAACRRTGRRRP